VKEKKETFNHIVYPQQNIKRENNEVWVFQVAENWLIIKQGSAVRQSERELKIPLVLHRPIQGKIKTLILAWKNNEYYANFACQLPKPKQLSLSEIKRQIGIDVGMINFFATSEGWKYANPQFLNKMAWRLKELYQSLSLKKHRRSKDDKTKNSKHFEKARLKLMKAFRQVVRRINDRNHKLSRKITDKFDLIAYEIWKLSEAFEKKDKKRKFTKYTVKGLSELGITDFFTKLDYKAKAKGKIVYPVEPRNTSKRCFECKIINSNLEKQRWFICANPLCDYEADRDINASKNILYKAQTELGTLSSERI